MRGLSKTHRAATLKFLPMLLLLKQTSSFQQTGNLHSCNLGIHKQQSLTSSQRIKPLYNSLLKTIESQASTAADTWSIECTPFLEPDLAVQIEERFRDRADVVAYRVVGGRRLLPEDPSSDIAPGEARRSRFVIMHPDLGLDLGHAESEYCTVIRVENVNVAASNSFPNALASIGVHLDNVGDIVVEDSSTAYLVVDPNVAKPCLRLLSKELVGVGINLSVCEENEFMPSGEIQEMKLSRVLERQMERKKYEQGVVQFG
eukprot:CAMPEP_0183707146 /NCGR_PEP_ID=MMETSP0737-20130205/3788_1 /TAXON_ID=385413 /ORGANISM="Thalassiosira miniscula, Strain CCMP1093" /LENGTH=258 /DNA_ID=CAMNT_0025934727 /DNA_START=121 /DNA_END=897 /DNA_ORIENTATION=+